MRTRESAGAGPIAAVLLLAVLAGGCATAVPGTPTPVGSVDQPCAVLPPDRLAKLYGVAEFAPRKEPRQAPNSMISYNSCHYSAGGAERAELRAVRFASSGLPAQQLLDQLTASFTDVQSLSGTGDAAAFYTPEPGASKRGAVAVINREGDSVAVLFVGAAKPGVNLRDTVIEAVRIGVRSLR